MEIPNSFARTLAKLEGRVKKLNMALHNTRHLYELGDQEMTYAVAMRLADTAEQVTLLARALPACTGNPIAAQELQDVMAINVVSDIVALYVMTDDAPSLCRHYYCSACAEAERTEVYVVPDTDFPAWLEREKSMPDEGVTLYGNRP